MKATLPKLTRKQALFVEQIVNNPKQSGTKAAMIATNSKTVGSAKVYASRTLANANVVSHLQNASQLVEDTLINTVRDWGAAENTRKREIAQQSAMYIHDKVHGKATQRVESTSTAVVISIDMSAQSLPDGVIEGE
jgi:hypothetical protein